MSAKCMRVQADASWVRERAMCKCKQMHPVCKFRRWLLLLACWHKGYNGVSQVWRAVIHVHAGASKRMHASKVCVCVCVCV